METIALIDYGMGNLRSVAKALECVSDNQAQVKLTSSAATIRNADRVVFPGQGAAKACMQAVQDHKLVEILVEAAAKKPFLGICMGLQVLLSRSAENDNTDCLDIFAGSVDYFGDTLSANKTTYKIPHMGWNQVKQAYSHPLWAGVPDNSRFYFVHSYYVNPIDKQLITGATDYGVDFASAIGLDNLFAVQFHPEKSADMGLQLLRNFVNWNGQV